MARKLRDCKQCESKRPHIHARATCCIGCGLPLLGFQTEPFTDAYGDVYHSQNCYEHCEREMAELQEISEQR